MGRGTSRQGDELLGPLVAHLVRADALGLRYVNAVSLADWRGAWTGDTQSASLHPSFCLSATPTRTRTTQLTSFSRPLLRIPYIRISAALADHYLGLLKYCD